jgi:hypothetical protein
MCSTPKGKGIREVMFTETRQRRRKRIRLVRITLTRTSIVRTVLTNVTDAGSFERRVPQRVVENQTIFNCSDAILGEGGSTDGREEKQNSELRGSEVLQQLAGC